MKLLSRIEIPGKPGKAIELLQGDLTVPDSQHPFDLLVLSAFPDDYVPTPSSLIGALHAKGLSVSQLATAKALDLRTHFSCWLSADTSGAGLGFKRLLCFEPLHRGAPPEVVADIFRALMPILGDHTELRTLAMPLVAAGDQGWPVAQILRPLLEAALHWMAVGMPLDVIRIVAHSDAQAAEASALFAAWRPVSAAPPPKALRDGQNDAAEYDVFLSYAHEDAALVQGFNLALQRQAPATRIFLDRQSIRIGMAWQPAIFETLDHCRKVVAMLSPSYLASRVCKEEFNIAWARSRDADLEILFPIFLYDARLPTYMSYRNYCDCREGSPLLLEAASQTLLQALQEAPGG